ncbi:MAG TPA: protein kinase [Verrucomicrobiota bacterium]|nr:protein kinase [Verrucomicrobiota bacterium]HRZ56971.1 protein kinase [Candidatus Paceibacterota bacterium]
MSLDPARTCPECGAELPAGTVPGQCPHCLLGLGLAVAGQVAEGEGRRREARTPKSGADHQPITDNAPLSTPHSSLSTTFGDYELLEEIARGGMGVIYKARQKSLDRIVALKMMLAEHLATKEQLERFRTEAQAAAQLHHPHIVAIHEVGEHAGQHFFSMDFVPGRNLAQIIADFGFRISDFKRSGRWMKAIAEAVRHAHEHGILHRDLKPSNILIDEEDQPRITDFGLAKRLTGGSELTLNGQVLGSPNYLSPEQAAGTHTKVGPASDVYALGAILYHLLTGRPPFQADTLTTLLRQVVDTEPVAPRRLNPSIPHDLETVCLKCLEKDPGRRYGTAQMVAEEVGRFLEGKPVLARPVGRVAKSWRWCRRNPRLALATGTALLSLLIGLAGVTWQWRQAQFERARAEAEALLARRNAYAADMNLVQQALEAGELGRARELLNRHRPATSSSSTINLQPSIDLRGWEWRYLWARCQGEERFTLCQYSNAVWALAFSPDGKWLAVRRRRGAVALRDAVAKRAVAELPGAGDYCAYKALAFSPAGDVLAWGNQGADKTPQVSLWDLRAQQETARLPHSALLVSLAFSPDGKVLATLTEDGTVHIWDVASRQVVTNYVTAPVAVFGDRSSLTAPVTPTSAGGGSVGSNESDASSVRPPSIRAAFHTFHYGCVLFSPDGRRLALGEARPQIRLWDWATGREEEPIRLPATADGITALAFSPDSTLLAVGCGFGHNDVHVWDLTARTERRFAGHSGWVAGLAFSPDGQKLATVSVDQTLRLWDVARGVEWRRFRGNEAEVWAVVWSPLGRDLVTGATDGTVRYWDPNAKPTDAYAPLPGKIRPFGLAFLPDSKSFLVVTRPEGGVEQRDATTLQETERLSFLGTNHVTVDLSGDGRWLALGDTNGSIQVWDFPSRRLATNLVFPNVWGFVVMFSPRGQYLNAGALASDGSPVPKFWEVPTWRELSLKGINLTNLSGAAFSPAKEGTFAFGYADGTVALWDIVTGRREAVFDSHLGENLRLNFSADGKQLVAAELNGQIMAWDTATRQAAPLAGGHTLELHAVVFSPDGRRLFAAGANPKYVVEIWDVATGREVATLPGETGKFYPRLSFSPDGHTLLAASLEDKVLFWRAPSWEEIEAAEIKKTTR